MMHTCIALVAVNLSLLLFIGGIRQENPFDLLVLLGLAVLNAIGFVTAAIVTNDSPSDALYSFAVNVLPFLVVIGIIALVVFVNVRFESQDV